MLLWFCLPKGTLVSKKITNIVGTRKNDFYGQDFCQKLIKYLAVIDPIIVPGFAYGIDVIAHKQALKLGLDKVVVWRTYLIKPIGKIKRNTLENSKKRGFVTDFNSSEVFDRNNFLRRNRIILGLATAIVVIQSNIKGGIMNTADYPHQYSRDLFMLPG